MRFSRAALRTMMVVAIPALTASLVLVFNSALGAPNGVSVHELDGFRLSVGKHEGRVSAIVVSDLENADTFAEYADANSRRARSLITVNSSQAVPVTVTFNIPMPLDEARDLATEAGIETEVWHVVNRQADGTKTSTFFPRALPDDLPTIIGSDGVPIAPTGAMGLKGIVPATPEGLGRLLDDTRIRLADTTEYAVRQWLATRPEFAGIPDSEITVVLKIAYLNLDW